MNNRLQRRPFRNSGKMHGKRLQDLGRRGQSGPRLARQGGGEDAVHRSGSPWENSKLRDELLNGEIFTTLYEARVLIENWRR